jgi:hypothetical protein
VVALPRAFLVGVQNARDEQGHSYLTSNTEWQISIYQHPKRQNAENNPKFRMAYDIYSLGVVLLELGLWGLPHFRRFVSSPEEFARSTGARTHETLKQFVRGSTPGNQALGRGIHCSMGKRYREVVEFCLDRETSDGTRTIELIERVWKVLEALSRAL